jgi:hypothetical protein
MGAVAIRAGDSLVGVDPCPPLCHVRRRYLLFVTSQADLGALGRLEPPDIEDLARFLTSAGDMLARWPVAILALDPAMNILLLEQLGVRFMARHAEIVFVHVIRADNLGKVDLQGGKWRAPRWVGDFPDRGMQLRRGPSLGLTGHVPPWIWFDSATKLGGVRAGNEPEEQDADQDQS